MTSERPFNFALLGAGRIGRTHAAAIANNPQAKLCAVYDPIDDAAKSIARQYNCEIMDIETIAANAQIDGVAICTPTDTHADLIERFARAGQRIFCEKPIDLSIDRVRQCLKTVAAHNGQLMVGFNRRFDPHFRSVRDEIKRGAIGAVEQVLITSRDPAPPPYAYIEVSGGIFRDMMIHDFDMARFLLDEEIVDVFATGSVLVDAGIGARNDYDTAMAILRTATGKQAVITNSRRATYGYDQRIEAHGAKGMVSAQNPIPILSEVAGSNGFTRKPLHDFFMTRYIEAYAAEINHFVSAAHTETPLSPDGQDGLKSLAIAEAAVQSAREERVVKVQDGM